jgi:hypothetical protein
MQTVECVRMYGEKLGRSGQRYSPNKGSCTCSFQRKGDSKGQGNPVTDSEGAGYLVEAADDSQEESVGTAEAHQLVPPQCSSEEQERERHLRVCLDEISYLR